MKLVAYLFSAALGLLGVVFVVGHQGLMMRFVVGVVLLLAAIVLAAVTRRKPTIVQRNIVQRVELSGDVRPEQLACQKCGASLSPKHIEVRDGAVFAACEYCSATYQLEEEPNW